MATIAGGLGGEFETVALMLALSVIVKHTRAGLALRAVSYRFDTAALMGIDIRRIIESGGLMAFARKAAVRQAHRTE